MHPTYSMDAASGTISLHSLTIGRDGWSGKEPRTRDLYIPLD